MVFCLFPNWGITVADPEIHIKGGERGGGGGGVAVSKNIFFRPFGPQFGLRIRAGWGGGAPLDPPLNDDDDHHHQSLLIHEIVSLLHGLPRNHV